MNPYKRLEWLAPAHGQKYGVLAYVLARAPFVHPENQDTSCVGAWVFLRAFDDLNDARTYCDNLIKQFKLRHVTITRACRWRYLSTLLTVDQSAHTPLDIDRVLMQENSADIDQFHPTYRLRTDHQERRLLEERGNEGRITFLAHEIRCEEQDLETLRSLISHHEQRLQKLETDLVKCATAEVDIQKIIDSEETHARAIVGDEMWNKIKSKLQTFIPRPALKRSRAPDESMNSLGSPPVLSVYNTTLDMPELAPLIASKNINHNGAHLTPDSTIPPLARKHISSVDDFDTFIALSGNDEST